MNLILLIEIMFIRKF